MGCYLPEDRLVEWEITSVIIFVVRGEETSDIRVFKMIQ
jgi:hypothetical protein